MNFLIVIWIWIILLLFLFVWLNFFLILFLTFCFLFLFVYCRAREERQAPLSEDLTCRSFFCSLWHIFGQKKERNLQMNIECTDLFMHATAKRCHGDSRRTYDNLPNPIWDSPVVHELWSWKEKKKRKKKKKKKET